MLDLPAQPVHKDPPDPQESTEDLANQDNQERTESASKFKFFPHKI